MKGIDKLKFDLGDLLVRFSHLEHLTILTMVGLLEEPNIWDCMAMCTEYSSRKRLDVFGSLAKSRVHNEPCRAAIARAIVSMSQAEEVRNRLVHTVWLPTTGGGDTVFKMKPKADRKAGFNAFLHNLKDDEVQAAVQQIQDAISHLVEAIKLLQAAKLLRFTIYKES